MIECIPDALTLSASSWNGCPSSNWAELAAKAFASREEAAAEPTVLINVGANKGYNAAHFLSLWSHTKQVTTQKWWKAMYDYAHGLNGTSRRFGYLSTSLCGACGACHTRPPSPHTRTTGQVHMLELVPANRRLLRHLCAQMNVCDIARVHDYAASNVTRVEPAPDGSATSGVEYKSLAWPKITKHAMRKFDSTVEAIALDDFMQREKLQRVFTIDIDTEGWDALVLEGMRKTLADHRVTFVEFEYSGKGYWSPSFSGAEHRSLQKTIAWMYEFGYVCFMEAGPHLAPISGPCWNERYERRKWSNVLCAQDPVALSMLHGMAAHAYKKRMRKGQQLTK